MISEKGIRIRVWIGVVSMAVLVLPWTIVVLLGLPPVYAFLGPVILVVAGVVAFLALFIIVAVRAGRRLRQ